MPLEVLIAGGGPAALEAALALHRLAGDRVTTTLLAPETTFAYRPLSVLAPFSEGDPPAFPLDRIAEDAHFTHVQDRLQSVDPVAKTVTTADGARLDYDALLVAAGARPLPVPPGMIAFTGSKADQERIHGIVQDVEEGYAPASRSWSRARPGRCPPTSSRCCIRGARLRDGRRRELHLVTPEDAPLALFGARERGGSADLEEAGVTPRPAPTAEDSPAARVPSPRGAELDADAVVALPRLDGPRLPGFPPTPDGFIPTDQHGRVPGARRLGGRRRHRLPGQAGRPRLPAGRRRGRGHRRPRRRRSGAPRPTVRCSGACCSPAAASAACATRPPAARARPRPPRARCGGRQPRSPGATSPRSWPRATTRAP